MKILVLMVQYQDNKYLEYQSLNFLVFFIFQLQVSLLILKFFSFLALFSYRRECLGIQ